MIGAEFYDIDGCLIAADKSSQTLMHAVCVLAIVADQRWSQEQHSEKIATNVTTTITCKCPQVTTVEFKPVIQGGISMNQNANRI